MFEKHAIFGNKWSKISSYLDNRTDNSIKNHFYSSIRRCLRRIEKFLGKKNSTLEIKLIKPEILSKALLGNLSLNAS